MGATWTSSGLLPLRTSGSSSREVVIVGTQAGLEARLVPQAGLPLATIRAAGLKGMGGAKLLRNAAMLVPGFIDSERILQRHQFDRSQPENLLFINRLRALMDGLTEPATLPVKANGDAAVVSIPGGHQVKLRREDGVWRVEDFD